jgi:hypothetical protein
MKYLSDFVMRPNDEQRKYLYHLSQGYFAYHALGLDPKCQKFREDNIRSITWIIDSSAILPLLAVGCYNHLYAVDLFSRAQRLGLTIKTTEALFAEVVEHAKWAQEFVEKNGVNSIDFYRAATAQPGYRQNLFIDGFIQTANEASNKAFNTYMDKIFGPRRKYRKATESILESYGVETLPFESWPGFQSRQWLGQRDELEPQIERQRRRLGTYKSREQVKVEAEVMVILKEGDIVTHAVECYFISQSAVLNIFARNHESYTWRPESWYRLLICFPGVTPEPDPIAESMHCEYFASGIEIINEQCYLKFFANAIDGAQRTIDDVAARYRASLKSKYATELKDAFDRMPDLQKPLFAWQVLSKSLLEEKQKLKAAEDQIAELQKVGKLSLSEREQLERFRRKQADKLRKSKTKRRRAQSQTKRK